LTGVQARKIFDHAEQFGEIWAGAATNNAEKKRRLQFALDLKEIMLTFRSDWDASQKNIAHLKIRIDRVSKYWQSSDMTDISKPVYVHILSLHYVKLVQKYGNLARFSQQASGTIFFPKRC
jgi:hypothetical protein